MIKKDYDITKYLQQGNMQINQTLLNNIYKDQIDAKNTDIENILENAGYSGTKVRIVFNIVDDKIILEKVKINLDNLVITSPNANINKYQHIRQVVAQSIEIKEEDILFE